jgi:hypothetical protein
MAAFYAVYSFTRNTFGSAHLDDGELPEQAFDHAIRVIRIERFFHIFQEQQIQSWFLGWHVFLRFWNIYYGSLHFIVTLGVFVYLYVRSPARFTQWRNVLGFTTALALVGFSLYPLMPPRLLDQPASKFGGYELEVRDGTGQYHFVDTLERDGGLWSFDSGAFKDISNQYAAMPSLHIGWSLWCTLAMWPLVRRRWLRALLVLYPVATLFGIVVTANHYFLDALGGAVCLAIGYVLGTKLDEWWHSRHPDVVAEVA